MNWEMMFQWTVLTLLTISVVSIGSFTVKQIINYIKNPPMLYEFKTSFQTGRNYMSHNFENGIMIRTNLATGECDLYDKDKLIKHFKDMSLDKYDTVLYMAAELSIEKKNRQLQSADGSTVSTSKINTNAK